LVGVVAVGRAVEEGLRAPLPTFPQHLRRSTRRDRAAQPGRVLPGWLGWLGGGGGWASVLGGWLCCGPPPYVSSACDGAPGVTGLHDWMGCGLLIPAHSACCPTCPTEPGMQPGWWLGSTPLLPTSPLPSPLPLTSRPRVRVQAQLCSAPLPKNPKIPKTPTPPPHRPSSSWRPSRSWRTCCAPAARSSPRSSGVRGGGVQHA
jgi:hypothetical protein